jgi:hypothetical protein
VDLSRDLLSAWGTFSEEQMRWTFPSGATLSFGHMMRDADRMRYQSSQFAYIGFDQVESFTSLQYEFMLSRLRTVAVDPATGRTIPTRLRCTCNPADEEQPGSEWIMARWQAWLDEGAPNRAKPGQILWVKRRFGREVPAQPGERGAISRTFIPARLSDNPILLRADPGYRDRLDALPEPYRSAYLLGVWTVGGAVDARRVIPVDWIRQAQARWKPDGALGIAQTALGCDVGRGGDATVLARRFGNWIAPLERHQTPDTMEIPGLVMRASDAATVKIVDVIGVGAGVVDRLKEMGVPRVVPFNGAEKSTRLDCTGHFGFTNMRAQAAWTLREHLDPSNPDPVSLPPDPELLADLASARWYMRSNGIAIEEKDKIASRLGRSPDSGDAVMMAFGVGHDGPPASVMLPNEYTAKRRSDTGLSSWRDTVARVPRRTSSWM